MALNESVNIGRKYRRCIDNTPGNKKWTVFSFWTHARDVTFDDDSVLQDKLGNFKGTTTNENQVAGYAADITLLKSIKTSLTNLITSLTNLVNSINNRLGGLRFYEDSTGKYVVGADSVPKKLGSGINNKISHLDSTYTVENVEYDIDNRKRKLQKNYIFNIKSVADDYKMLNADNFYFNVTKSRTSHYISPGFNIPDPKEFIHKKNYNPQTGILRVENVAGGSYEDDKDGGSGARIDYEILEFELLVL